MLRKGGVALGGLVNYRGTDPSDDVFSFGTLLFETFAGRIPFPADEDIAARILSNRLCEAIQELDLTTVRKQFGSHSPILIWAKFMAFIPYLMDFNNLLGACMKDATSTG